MVGDFLPPFLLDPYPCNRRRYGSNSLLLYGRRFVGRKAWMRRLHPDVLIEPASHVSVTSIAVTCQGENNECDWKSYMGRKERRVMSQGAPLSAEKHAVRVATWVILLVGLSPPNASANDLVRIRAATPETEVGQTTQITILLRPRENMPLCGLNIEYGDGTEEYVKVRGPNPSGSVQHIYRQAGTAVVKIEGKTRFQGLGTTFACGGSAQITSIKILPEGATARRAAAETEKQAAIQREQAEARAAVERAQAQTQAAQAEAQRQRTLAEQATQRANMERAKAERLARDNNTAPQTPPQPTEATKQQAIKAKSSMDL